MSITLQLLRERIKNLKIVSGLSAANFSGRVYLVGGAIRELALGESPVDYDFALEDPADAQLLEELFGAKGFSLGKRPAQAYRIVTDGLVADLSFFQEDILTDLARRDFTMNAIGYDIASAEIFDPYDGLADISHGVIRYPRRESIKEDPLRMLKAIRHLSLLPNFTLAPELVDAMREYRELICLTAPERIKYELNLMMYPGNAHLAMVTLRETGLLFLLFPELRDLEQMDREKGFELETLGHTIDGFKYLDRARAFHPFNEEDLRNGAYALLFHDLGKAYTFSYDDEKQRVHFFYHEKHSKDLAGAIMERLRFSSHEVRVISNLIENHMRVFLISHEGATEKAIRRIVYKMGDLTPPLVLLTLLDMYGSSGGEENETTIRVRQRCAETLSAYDEWQREPLPRLLNGYDLLALGFPEGPRVGKIIDAVREKQISGEITDRNAALEFVRAKLIEPRNSNRGPRID